MKLIKSTLCMSLAISMLAFSGCGSSVTDAIIEAAQTTSDTTETTYVDLDSSDLTDTVYTGKEVENEEDLAIFKFNFEAPDGYEVIVDSSEGKYLYNEELGASITVKAQNYKEEFTDLATFADSACANLKLTNMLYQADTDFDDPIDTTVAGFDAVLYYYYVTAYIYTYETDENGDYVLDEDGNAIKTGDKEVYGEFSDCGYFFYSDEDVFYILCEAPKDTAEANFELVAQFIDSITITPAAE